MVRGIKYPHHHLMSPFVKEDLMIFGKFIASFGTVQPTFTNLRRIFSNPKSMRKIAGVLGALAKELKVDLVGGCETAGIPLSSSISMVSNIPAVYIKKQAKEHGTREVVEGKYRRGQSILIIDDAIGDGNSKIDFVNNCLHLGLKVKGVAVVLDTSVPLLPYYKQHHIPVYSLVSYRDFMLAYLRSGKITQEFYDLVVDFFSKRDEWTGSRSQARWKQFYQVAKKNNIKLEICA